MKKLSGLLSGSALVIVMGLAAGCGGGGGSSHGNGGGGGGGGGGGTVQGISTPSSVSVVTAQNADQVQ